MAIPEGRDPHVAGAPCRYRSFNGVVCPPCATVGLNNTRNLLAPSVLARTSCSRTGLRHMSNGRGCGGCKIEDRGAVANHVLGLVPIGDWGTRTDREPRPERPGRQDDNEQPGVVILGAGGSTPRHAHQLQVQAAQCLGICRLPPPMVCPACDYSFFFDNTICVYCTCAAAAAAQDDSTGHQGGDAPAFQNLSPGLQQPPPQAQWGPVPDDRRCPACCFFPGRMADRPWRHVCRFFLARVPGMRLSARGRRPSEDGPSSSSSTSPSAPPRPQQHPQQPPPPIGAAVPAFSSSSSSIISGTWENKLPPDAGWESAVGRPAEGPPSPNSGITAFGGQSRRRIQFSPPTSPPERIAKPVHDDGWCPACLYTRAPTVFQPRTHVCLCDSCIYVDGIVCPVCANFGRPGDSSSRPAPPKGPFDSV